jgi:hypothetical protein
MIIIVMAIIIIIIIIIILSLILWFIFSWIRFCYQKPLPNMTLVITARESILTLIILKAKYRLAAANLPTT